MNKMSLLNFFKIRQQNYIILLLFTYDFFNRFALFVLCILHNTVVAINIIVNSNIPSLLKK